MGDETLDDLIPKDTIRKPTRTDIPSFGPRVSTGESEPGTVKREHFPTFQAATKMFYIPNDMQSKINRKKK